jgi:hypothetical protein
LGIFLAESFVLLEEFRPCRSAAVFGLDGRFHFFSMVVDGLPTAADLLGLLCGRVARAPEACGGIGNPTAEGYGAHGGGETAGIDPSRLGSRGIGIHSLRKTAINDAKGISFWSLVSPWTDTN